jgi:hypothetical protein
VTSPHETPRSTLPPVQYKGEPLEAERGPGLGCFRFQVIVLVVLVVLTPVSVNVGWPDWASALLLFVTIGLLLLTGQTIIFLLRLVAAERRQGRRRPLAARTSTVGELEDKNSPATPAEASDTDRDAADAPPSPDAPMRE